MSGWVRDRNDGDRKLVYFTNLVDVNNLHSCKLTVRHGKFTILMVFTRISMGIFMGEMLVYQRVNAAKKNRLLGGSSQDPFQMAELHGL